MNRILKENATVPLFFAQTLIASLRDVGYNSTTSALCEHVDNAIEAGAREIRIYLWQRGVNGSYDIDVAVYDGGRGMSPNGSGGNGMLPATAIRRPLCYGVRALRVMWLCVPGPLRPPVASIQRNVAVPSRTGRGGPAPS